MATSRTIVLSAALTFALPSARAMAATCTPDSNGNNVGDGWGASWSFGPTMSRIVHAKTTIVPGRLPPLSNVGPLFLWPGISNPTSDLIQTSLDAWEGTENVSYCGASSDGGLPTQWCVEASVFGTNGQTNGSTVAIDPDDHVTIEYTLESDNETWLQTVTSQKLGKLVSMLTSKSGEMPKGGFGFATEADSCSFTVDTQYYLCTEIDLYAADPAFGATGVGGVGAQIGNVGHGSGVGTAQNIHTPDHGKTWLVDLVTLPAMNPQGTQTPPPTIDCQADAGSDGSRGSGDAGGSDGSAGSAEAADADGSEDSAGAGSSGSSGGSSEAGGAGGSGGSSGAASSRGTAGAGTTGSGSADDASTSPFDASSAAASEGSANGDTNGQGGGCGCRTAGSRTLPRGTLVGLVAIALFGAFRARRRAI